MTAELIKTTQLDAGILNLSLNRADRLNALSAELLQALSTALRQAKQDSAVKAVLLTGEGKAFCAGADIKQLAGVKNAAQAVQFGKLGQTVFSQLEQLGKPSLAAIHGAFKTVKG